MLNIPKIELSSDSKYKGAFSVYEDMYNESVAQIKKHASGKMPKPPLETASILLFTKAVKSFGAIAILVDSGYCEDAMVIIRTLAELAIQWAYIHTGDKNEIEKRAQQYIDFDEVEQERIQMKIQLADKDKTNIDLQTSKREQFKKKYGIKRKGFPSFFSGKSIEVMAAEIKNEDLKKLFKAIYSFYSIPAHSGPRSHIFYMEIDTNMDFSLFFMPSDNNIQWITTTV